MHEGVIFPTTRGPAEFQDSGSESEFADTTYSVLYPGGRYLDRSLEVFDFFENLSKQSQIICSTLSQSS